MSTHKTNSDENETLLSFQDVKIDGNDSESHEEVNVDASTSDKPDGNSPNDNDQVVLEQNASVDKIALESDSDETDILNINIKEVEAYASELCAKCTHRYQEFKSNVLINKGWMVWETFMVTFDFVLDLAVINNYFIANKDTEALILTLVMVNSAFVHIWASKKANHPLWVGIFSIGIIYECYKSWGKEKPTVKWDKFRYRHAVAEALPQTMCQAIFIDAATFIIDSKYSYLPLFSCLFSISNLCYTITEKATSSETDDRAYFVESLMAAPCSSEAICRIFILLYFLSDTSFRVLTLSLFLNVDQFKPWSYLIIFVMFLLFTFLNHRPSRQIQYTFKKYVELVGKGLLSLLVSHGLLNMKRNQNVSNGIQTILLEVAINAFLVGMYLSNDWNKTIFQISCCLGFTSFFCMIPSIWYMLNREKVFQEYRESMTINQSKLEIATATCTCQHNLYFCNLI